jgi:7-carboxy-7-deazaguanine synthase
MVRHVVITGGEPMLHDDLPRLCELLRAEGRHVTIETSGTRYLAVACDLISISPKLSNSTPWGLVPLERIRRHERVRRAATAVIARLMAEHEYQLKFVIDRPEDFPEVEAYLSALPAVNRERVMLMPQGVAVEELAEKARWLEPYCRAHRLQFCPRRQIEWFGGERGK